jgi:Protein of unknown function (DUF1570)
MQTFTVLPLLITIWLAPASMAVCDDSPDGTDAEHPVSEVFRIRKGTTEQQTVGTAIAQAQDGTLLIQRSNGAVVLVMPDELLSRQSDSAVFELMTADQLAADLLQQTGISFHITETEHYVICSNSSEEYATFCGRLLELVHAQFQKFFGGHPAFQPGDVKLPVIIFAHRSQLQEFAQRQHPDVDFSDTPGYYSVRDNQIMLMDLSGDPRIDSQSAIRRLLMKMPRQMATVVHEAVHQLAFNCGLQVRMADNPLWLSEGLALHFETGSPRASLLWNRPGAVNPFHHPDFVRNAASGMLPISVRELVQSDQTFLDSATNSAAYAEGWALTTFLIKKERDGFDRLMRQIAARTALVGLSPEERLMEFETAIGKSADEIETQMVRYIKRLRAPR